uniref:Uncharacterized protein n=1 Tax=Panagrolaimus sp. JU765 TaxID=591449 RepID=A0AC34Q7N0_9BILA
LKVLLNNLKQVENDHLNLTTEDATDEIKIETLEHRREFLKKLLKTLENGLTYQKNNEKTNLGLEKRAKQQINDLENDIEKKDKDIENLESLIKKEQENVEKLKQRGENFRI